MRPERILALTHAPSHLHRLSGRTTHARANMARENMASNLPGLAGAAFLLLLFLLLRKLARAARGPSSTDNLRGPPSAHLIYGNLREMRGLAGPARVQGWMEEHGKVLRVRTIFNVRPVCVLFLRCEAGR